MIPKHIFAFTHPSPCTCTMYLSLRYQGAWRGTRQLTMGTACCQHRFMNLMNLIKQHGHDRLPDKSLSSARPHGLSGDRQPTTAHPCTYSCVASGTARVPCSNVMMTVVQPRRRHTYKCASAHHQVGTSWHAHQADNPATVLRGVEPY